MKGSFEVFVSIRINDSNNRAKLAGGSNRIDLLEIRHVTPARKTERRCTNTPLWRKSHSSRCAIATAHRFRQESGFAPGALFSEQVEKQGEEKRDQDAGGEGEIEGEIFPFDGNITRKSAEPGNFIGENQDNAQCGHQAAGHDQYFAEATHGDPFPERGGLG
jgi:hypothetical protein